MPRATLGGAALLSLAAGYAGPLSHGARRSGRLGADARSRSAAPPSHALADSAFRDRRTKRYALMWSGGKDSALALWRVRRRGLRIDWLVNVHDRATGRVRFHATPTDAIARQAEAADVQLVSVPTDWATFDESLSDAFAALVLQGCRGVVFGDIHLADVRGWYEERTSAAGLEHIEPLWGEDPRALLEEFVAIGGRAVLTCVETAKLDVSWLGRVIDGDFLRDVGATGIDPCGENGEYHSFAFAGPFFARPLAWRLGQLRDDGRFAQIDVVCLAGSGQSAVTSTGADQPQSQRASSSSSA